MGPRRIYLPLSYDQVRELAHERRLAAPVQGWAAGSLGRVDARIAPAAAQEEAEYLAFRAAADHAIGYDEGARRVIASADAAEGAIREVTGPASSTVSGPVPVVVTEDLPLRRIASLHIDEASAPADDPGDDADEDSDADGGDPDARATDVKDTDTADGEEPDLLWYDITELDAVLAELDS